MPRSTARARQQIILTAVAVAVAVALFAAFPWKLITLLYLPSMPLALTLLWLTRDVPSPEERSARADAEHARQSHGDEAPAVPA